MDLVKKLWIRSTAVFLTATLIAALVAGLLPTGSTLVAREITSVLPQRGDEIIEERTENSKRYYTDENSYKLVISTGTIHYKDDYTDKSEEWKDIDLTWVGNRITKAPYELMLDGKKITIKDKKSGEISSIELLSSSPVGLKWEIVPEYTRVSFRHILPSGKIPFEARFKIAGKIPFLSTRAFDDEGELELETSIIDGILTEKLTGVKDKETGVVRPAKGQIKVDPTWQVTANSDDCGRTYALDSWSIGITEFLTGYQQVARKDWGAAARFLNITIPTGSTIDSAVLVLTSRALDALNDVNTRIRAEANINPATFSTQGDFDARTWTTAPALVNWDAIPAWVAETEYTSPDISTLIQAVIDLGGWTSGNPIAILWDDFEQRSTAVNNTWRRAYSHNSSAAKAPKLVITVAIVSPTVTNSAADGITTTGADLHGEITNTGGANATNRGFEWDIDSGAPYANNWDEAGGFGTGVFEHGITDLPPGYTIYWRAYATNSAGTGYSGELSFNTSPVPGWYRLAQVLPLIFLGIAILMVFGLIYAGLPLVTTIIIGVILVIISTAGTEAILAALRSSFQ